MTRRKWAFLIFGTVIVIAFVLVWSSMDQLFTSANSPTYQETTISGSGIEKIVQLHIEGIIAEQSSFSSSFSGQRFVKQLQQVLQDDTVKAIVLRINSPGGAVVTSDEIYEKLLEIKQSGKKIVVSMGTVAASGGYYIAAPADMIFANRATLTGSLGVIFTLPNYQGMAEWIGYQETNIQSGSMKDIGNPLRELRDDEKALYQSLVDESYERFVDIIALGRNLTRNQVYSLADGRIYSGQQALANGLIDKLGSLEDAIIYTRELLASPDMRVIEYQRPFSFSDLLLTFQQRQQQTLSELVTEVVKGHMLPTGLMYIYMP